LEIVKYLVEKRAEIEVKTVNNTTPLHISTQNGNFEIVNNLVEKGAEIEATEKI